ncbi:hypothetical protein UFOVP1165_48 [uncultured Caudovirales phage]|uniref:Uncharacterized protein n=1 Tax=uncultured Caudovirales phage TaxID=2100421 RepID=A0A6J5R610_9CAUD|nr:hypothetical protein UFOVP1165_48 [uncultured Caudovirales phage]
MLESNALLLLQTACCGNRSAEDFVNTMFDVLHFFDDVSDKDTHLKNADVEQALWQALIELPRNQFYRDYFLNLNPIVANAIQDWITANEFEERSESENELMIAYITRSSYVTLMTEVARICGGVALASSVAKDLRLIAHYEGFAEYKSALANEKKYRASDAARFEE